MGTFTYSSFMDKSQHRLGKNTLTVLVNLTRNHKSAFLYFLKNLLFKDLKKCFL